MGSGRVGARTRAQKHARNDAKQPCCALPTLLHALLVLQRAPPTLLRACTYQDHTARRCPIRRITAHTAAEPPSPLQLHPAASTHLLHQHTGRRVSRHACVDLTTRWMRVVKSCVLPLHVRTHPRVHMCALAQRPRARRTCSFPVADAPPAVARKTTASSSAASSANCMSDSSRGGSGAGASYAPPHSCPTLASPPAVSSICVSHRASRACRASRPAVSTLALATPSSRSAAHSAAAALCEAAAVGLSAHTCSDSSGTPTPGGTRSVPSDSSAGSSSSDTPYDSHSLRRESNAARRSRSLEPEPAGAIRNGSGCGTWAHRGRGRGSGSGRGHRVSMPLHSGSALQHAGARPRGGDGVGGGERGDRVAGELQEGLGSCSVPSAFHQPLP
eukprot:364722-Chlamydomonas_euryale.AAC.1